MGDGNKTFTQTFPLTDTRPFGNATFTWKTDAKAGNGRAWRFGISRATARSSTPCEGKRVPATLTRKSVADMWRSEGVRTIGQFSARMLD